jgi:hypothetical protein
MKKSKNPTARDIRLFGLVILIGFGIIGWLFLHRGKTETAHLIWKISGLVAALSIVWPKAATPIYHVWMKFGAVLGFVMSRLVLTIIFFGIVTPVAVFFRLCGRDELKRAKKRVATYWSEHPELDSKEDCKHIF